MSAAAVVQIGDTRLGGAVGEYPTAALGTLFFNGQKLLIDSERGIFDPAAARDQIRRAKRAAAQAGISLFLDIVAETPAAMEKYVEFAAVDTDLPLLIDASSDEAKVAGLMTAQAYAVLDRTVYNSIGADSGREELELIANCTPAAIIVRATDPMDFQLESSLAIVRHMEESLPGRIHDRFLLDIGFLDEASVRISANLAQEVRERSGHPVGGAPCNGIYMWESLKNRGEEAIRAALCATLGYVAAFGLDFLFIGPLRNIGHIAQAVGATDVYNRYELRSSCLSAPLPTQHPMKAMFQ